MVLKFLVSFVFVFSSLSLFGNEVRCERKLLPYLQAIQKIPEGRELIQTILEEGSFQIMVQENSLTKKFHACWDTSRRIIFISLEIKPQDDEIISSLIFELHNAATTSQYDYLDRMAFQRRINKQDYVRFSEHIEYINSINASKIVEIGVKKGVFPKNTYLHVYKDFDEYLYYQKIGGHTGAIAKNFDLMTE